MTPAYKAKYEEENRERRRAKKAADYKLKRAEILAKANARYHAKAEEISVQKQGYYLSRRDELIAAAKQWNSENPESKRRNNLLWNKANPECGRTQVRNRSARIRSSEGLHTKTEILHLAKAKDWRCANPVCSTDLTIRYHADHIKPLAKGGSNWISNIQLLCPPCNFRKGAKDPAVWNAEIDGMINANSDRQLGCRTGLGSHKI